jgi:hypothetical protein
MPDLPPNITDAGPLHEQPDPHDGYDAYDWLQEASELCLHAVHADRGGARIDNMKRAKDALTNAISMAEDDVLKRRMSFGRHEINPDEVAESDLDRRDLARDMFSLGWRMENGRYRRPAPHNAISLGAVQLLNGLLNLTDPYDGDGVSIFCPRDGQGGCTDPPPAGGCNNCAALTVARPIVKAAL